MTFRKPVSRVIQELQAYMQTDDLDSVRDELVMLEQLHQTSVVLYKRQRRALLLKLSKFDKLPKKTQADVIDDLAD